ncbi:MAG: HepT-like ribonuclease domain-containing protein [Bryobacteraceae bacterium]
MKRPERVEDYLEHIAEAIDRATSYLRPIPDLEAFQTKPQVQDAVVRNIEVIGEAVSRIQKAAPDFIKKHSELPRGPNAWNAQHSDS